MLFGGEKLHGDVRRSGTRRLRGVGGQRGGPVLFATPRPRLLSSRLTDRRVGQVRRDTLLGQLLCSGEDDDDEGWIFPLCCCSSQLSYSFYRLFADQRFWTKTVWMREKKTRTKERVDLCTCFFFSSFFCWCFKSINKLSTFSLNRRRHLSSAFFFCADFPGGLPAVLRSAASLRFSHLQTDVM